MDETAVDLQRMQRRAPQRSAGRRWRGPSPQRRGHASGGVPRRTIRAGGRTISMPRTRNRASTRCRCLSRRRRRRATGARARRWSATCAEPGSVPHARRRWPRRWRGSRSRCGRCRSWRGLMALATARSVSHTPGAGTASHHGAPQGCRSPPGMGVYFIVRGVSRRRGAGKKEGWPSGLRLQS